MKPKYEFYFREKPRGGAIISITSNSDNRTTNFVRKLEANLTQKLLQPPTPIHTISSLAQIKITAAYKLEISVEVRFDHAGQEESLLGMEKAGFKKRPNNL